MPHCKNGSFALRFRSGSSGWRSGNRTRLWSATDVSHLLPFLMLPARLLRSTRPFSRLVSRHTAAPWRSSSSLIRLGQRFYSDSVTNAPPSPRHLPPNPSDPVKTQQPDEPKYSLTFTCKVPECDERSSHMFSKRAYHHGIVIIQCPKCENRYVATKRTTLIRVSQTIS